MLPSAFPQPWTVSLSLQLRNPPQHDAFTTKLHCWGGIRRMMSSACFPPDMTLRTEARQYSIGFTRPEKVVSHNLRNFRWFFLQTPTGNVSVTENRLHLVTAIKPRLVESWTDGCLSGSFSHLHKISLELSQSDYQNLGLLSWPSIWFCSEQRPYIWQGNNPVVSRFLADIQKLHVAMEE